MWYSLQYNRVVRPKELKSLHPNISFPISFVNTGEVTPWIAEITQLVPVTVPPEPEDGVDYDSKYQQVILNQNNPTLNEDKTEAVASWDIVDSIFEEVDENGNVVRTKEQVRADIEKQQEEIEKLSLEAEKREAETRADQNAKGQRNFLLSVTDKYVIPDWPHESEEVRQAWVDYRQALRDLTSASDWPETTFPEPPSPIE